MSRRDILEVCADPSFQLVDPVAEEALEATPPKAREKTKEVKEVGSEPLSCVWQRSRA